MFASDHALVLAFSAQPSEAPEVQARVFEAAVYRHLRSLTDSDAELAYLRVDDRHELDFAIRCDGRWLGVEVTTTRSLEDWKLGRLIAAGARMRAERLVLIYGGLFDGEREGVRVIPIHRFLGQPRAALEISGR